LPASDIPSFVGKGDVDLGITGHDVVLESEMNGLVTEVLRMDFGKCLLQVQVPEASPIKTVDDLAGKRVVSSFQALAGDYFNKVDDRLQLVGEKRTKIQYVGGSVEAACALGLADGIGKWLSTSVLRFPDYHNSVDLVGKPGFTVCPIFLADRCFQNLGKQCVLLDCTRSRLFYRRKLYFSSRILRNTHTWPPSLT
jgi:ATP phosphoribosyltransferase